MGRKVKLKRVECARCGHKWTPRSSDVRTCSKCRSPYWDRPRQKGKEGEEK